MQLERISAVVRPRRPWEAVDLGFVMARSWWAPLMRIWLATVAPFYLGVVVAFTSSPKWWALLAVWWAKPLYDRVPLYVFSRALFGPVPRVTEVLRQLPRLWTSGTLGALTIFRLDPMRSFLLPVGLLEGLRGKAHRQRLAVLKQDGDDATATSWLTAACFVFELGTLAALVALLDLFRPETVEGSFWKIFTFLTDSSAPSWYYFLTMALCFLALTWIGPFYVAAGFALYLNRRTQLEGWDVELAFRRLAGRLEHTSPESRNGEVSGKTTAGLAAVVLFGVLTLAPCAPGRAQEVSPEPDPQEAVEEILADPEFGARKTLRFWRLRDVEPKEDKEGLDLGFLAVAAALFAKVFEVLLWSAAAVAFVVLALFAWRRYYRPRRPERLPEEDGRPKIVAGLDVSASALPEDVAGAALARWREGRPDEALSLLYRGALAWLVDRRKLPAKESWTEGDCLRHLRRSSSERPPATDYFARLTSVWLRTAYAHRPPSDSEIEDLASGWKVHFGAAS